MKLHQKPYQNIKEWIKKIELRLYDKKRQQIKLWDTIEFTNNDNKSDFIIHKKVTWLLHYQKFEDIINDFELSMFGDWIEKQTLIETLYTFYSKEDEQRYWILGIRIK